MEAKYHDNNHVTVGLNIRLFDKGINRNTNQIVIMQIFKSLSAISASKQISVYIYGCSKIPKFLIEEANKYSVKVYLISGYNSNNSWGFMNSIEDSHETSEYQITIEQIILRFSTLVMCPPSGSMCLPLHIGKKTIVYNAVTQVSHYQHVIWLPKGISENELILWMRCPFLLENSLKCTS